jgi:hypothetical protein
LLFATEEAHGLPILKGKCNLPSRKGVSQPNQSCKSWARKQTCVLLAERSPMILRVSTYDFST